MDAVLCENLHKTFKVREKKGFFGGVKKVIKAVNGVSFGIPKGMVFGLVGPNGAGKTTTIKILSTLLIPDMGKAFVGGHDVLKEAGKVREVLGLVLAPDKGFYARLTGIENLVYYGRLYGLSKSQASEKAEQLVEIVNLGRDGYRLFDEYSLGMKAKLSIAKCLIHDPPILFFDEPTIGLDPISARKIRLLISELAKQGKTILLTSHNMWEVETLCSTVAVINKGRIAAIGSPRELKDRLGLKYVVEVEFLGDGEVETDWPTELGERGNPVVRIQTAKPNEDLIKVIDQIRSDGYQIGYVRVHEPSLEEVFAKVVADETP